MITGSDDLTIHAPQDPEILARVVGALGAGGAIMGSYAAVDVYAAGDVTMTERGATEARPILIGYDGSEDARAAVARAGKLLRPRRTIVICVWSPIVYSASSATLGAPGGVLMAGADGLDAVARERAQELAEEGAELARHAGLDADARAIQAAGSAWHGIVRCAEELDAAVVVTGTRGRSGMAATFLGSTAQGVLHHAYRPVLVVAGD